MDPISEIRLSSLVIRARLQRGMPLDDGNQSCMTTRQRAVNLNHWYNLFLKLNHSSFQGCKKHEQSCNRTRRLNLNEETRLVS